MTGGDWRDQLEAFFELRARSISETPTLEDLCYIAGRNARLWADESLLADLRRNMLDLMEANEGSSVLEVGCAAGFLAKILAPSVGRYVGIDLAEAPLEVARRLGLNNAEFCRAHGESLQFSGRPFDSAFCYDVFSNFPSFAAGEPIIVEMLRVVRPGGRVLIGSIPDRDKAEELQAIAKQLAADFEGKFGPEASRAPLVTIRRDRVKPELLPRIAGLLGFGQALGSASAEVRPEITSYYFDRRDFVELGERLGVETRVCEIHSMNPYFGTRFNVVFVSR